jgi:hypothetical protein
MAVSQFRKKRLLAATKISDKTYRQVTKEIAEIESREKSAFSSPPQKRSCSLSQFFVEIRYPVIIVTSDNE